MGQNELPVFYPLMGAPLGGGAFVQGIYLKTSITLQVQGTESSQM